ncbi:MAG TPA: dTDP-4-amino-4,6-dideoxygalactose transaminase [Gemmatimonadaceae bacterium]|nr:dTDP-4-amino-4,6-dideoxygalactose transaminase [Gemmatimonadaceae bacterium]
MAGQELEYIAAAVRNGRISGDGEFTRRCHAILEQELPGTRALLTTSCTHALEMAAILLDITAGDEVIIPSFTFVSTVNAFVLRGATPVFADIRADTLNLDESRVEALVTPRTRAIVAVHYAGIGCEMDALAGIARRHGLALIEDNAHGLFGRYRGRPLGTFGAMAALSFHETKNMSCGEGGALLVSDPALRERAEIIREKGTDRSRFFRREVDKYTWIDIGSSYLPSDMLAAFLCAQLEQRTAIQARRRHIWTEYASGLAEWAGRQGARLPMVPSHCEQPYHLFYMLLPTEVARRALIGHLADAGVMAVSHYVPLHRAPMALTLQDTAPDCPVTDDVSARLLRLPLFPTLSAAEQARIIDAINGWSAPA